MNHFIGVVGARPESTLRLAVNRLQESTRWRTCRFKPTLKYANIAGGLLLTKAHGPSASILPDHIPIILSSRKSVTSFIHANQQIACVNSCKAEQTCSCEHSYKHSQTSPYPAANTPALTSEHTTLFCDQLLNKLHGTSEQVSACLQGLKGDFRLLFVGHTESCLTLAVSPFNPQTLFYIEAPNVKGAHIVSTCIEFLLAIVSPKPSAESLALWLGGRPDPHRSMYANIHQVRAGTNVLITKNGVVSTQTFWDIDPKHTVKSDDDKQLAASLRELISQSVRSHVSAAAQNEVIFTQMSGGMDSTSVTALTHEALNAATRKTKPLFPNSRRKESSKTFNKPAVAVQHRLHTVSHTYVNTQSCDEMPNIQAMMGKFKCAENHFIDLDKYTQMSFAELYPTHAQSPGMVLSPKYYEEARLLRAHNAKLLLTGNGGDEMFWGHRLAYYDRVKKADTKVISEVIQGAKALNLPVLPTLKSVFVRPFIKYDLMPFLRLAEDFAALRHNNHVPSWLTPMSKKIVDEHNHSSFNAFATKGSELSKFARYEGLFNTSTFNSMRSYQAVFEEFGLHVEHPLFTSAIAEFSFAVAQKHHLSDKYPKLLLRKAMTHDLPEQVCWDDHKIVFDQHFTKLVQQNAASIRVLLSHTGLEELGLIDNAALLKVFDNLVQSSTPSLNVDLLYAILVQSWYQEHVLGG